MCARLLYFLETRAAAVHNVEKVRACLHYRLPWPLLPQIAWALEMALIVGQGVADSIHHALCNGQA